VPLHTMKKSSSAALLAVLAVSTAACGGGSSSSSSSSGEEGDGGAEVTVSLVPVAGSAPVVVAQEQGCFEDEGLSVTISEVAGPAAIAALQNGESQFASLGASVVITAASQGVPLMMVSGRTVTPETPEEDETTFMVMPDSGIEGPEDLAGTTVATQTLGSVNTLMARAAVDNLGGDSGSIQFVDIPFPEMMSALRSGSVVGAVVSEPFVTAMQDEGAVSLFSVGAEAFDESTPIGVIATTQAHGQDNPDHIEGFQAAMTCAVEWIEEDETRFRALLPSITSLSEDQASRMILPTFTTELEEAGVQALTDELLRQGLIETEPEISELLP
jgi:NitT/TauT family transport system substrate-binding protein